MTKKHFKVFAEMISKIKYNELQEEFIERIGEICCKENNRFNWLKWREACYKEVK